MRARAQHDPLQLPPRLRIRRVLAHGLSAFRIYTSACELGRDGVGSAIGRGPLVGLGRGAGCCYSGGAAATANALSA